MSATLSMDPPVTSPHEAEAAGRPEPRGHGRILRWAILGEGAFVILGAAWVYQRDLPWAWSDPSRVSPAAAIAIGLLAAAGFAVMAFIMLRVLPGWRPVAAMRRLYRDVMMPLFRGCTFAEIAAISVLAGIGEEVLFRGAAQHEAGLILTSLVFGALHIGGRSTVALGGWAALLGALLGWLAIATGGLLAPIVAHVVYDALALSYIRWGPAPPEPNAAGLAG